MAMRPPSSSGQRPGSSIRGRANKAPPTANTRPPGTASRLSTGMLNATTSGGGVALRSQVRVDDRPITHEGLTIKTGLIRGPQRQVQDKSYFLGMLRSKITEINNEVGRLHKQIIVLTEDQGSFLSYEKRAESLALEIKDMQGNLGDYNTLVDKLNTENNVSDIQFDCQEIRAQNERESKVLEDLFGTRQMREQNIKHLQVELQQEKSMTENLISHMSSENKQKYMKLKDQNEHMLKQLEMSQQNIDQLNVKRNTLEEELASSPVKQEAVRLYGQLRDLERRRDQMIEEDEQRGTPAQERERMLKQVKEDNSEIATMEKQSKNITESLERLKMESLQLESNMEDNQSERNQKYKDLKKREEVMDEFLTNFEETRKSEIEKNGQAEDDIVLIMEHMSRNMNRFDVLPSQDELETMKKDLTFKESEMEKSQQTSMGLAGETAKLHSDLQKVEQLDSKINNELVNLKEKIDRMSTDLVKYNDIDKLRADANIKKKKLMDEKVTMRDEKESFKDVLHKITKKYESAKLELNENETHSQLGNLERKWQHLEQNNFSLQEFIATKLAECDFSSQEKKATTMISDYNSIIIDRLNSSYR